MLRSIKIKFKKVLRDSKKDPLIFRETNHGVPFLTTEKSVSCVPQCAPGRG